MEELINILHYLKEHPEVTWSGTGITALGVLYFIVTKLFAHLFRKDSPTPVRNEFNCSSRDQNNSQGDGAIGKQVNFNAEQTSSSRQDIKGIGNVCGTAPILPHLFVGRDDDMVAMRQRLCGESATTMITAVRGWPGIGKTTLAAALAHDTVLKKSFPDGVLWTALGTSPDPLAELGQWLLALGDDPQHYQRLEDRHNRLSGLLLNRRMLLIVDDVWDAADAQPFFVGGRDCRTLMTTREPEVAQKIGLPEQAIYRLLELSEKDSIELIRRLSPESVEQDRKGVERLVQELEGLPLALKIAGSLLATEAAMGWGVSDLLDELAEGTRLLKEQAPADRMDFSGQTTPTVAALFKKSTDRLDTKTWERFGVLGIFASKPATFDLAAMATAWNEENPHFTVRELVKRGLLEPYGDGRFHMHALLTVHAQSMWEK